jgi:hypothetical protein
MALFRRLRWRAASIDVCLSMASLRSADYPERDPASGGGPCQVRSGARPVAVPHFCIMEKPL